MSRRTGIERRAARAFHLKDYARARRYLEELLALRGENPRTRHALGLCYERLGLLDEALDAAQRCHESIPDYPGNLRLLARLHIARGAPEAARAYVADALRLLERRPPDGWWARLRERLGRGDAEDGEWCVWAREFLRQPDSSDGQGP